MNFISNILYWISTGLLVPVIVLLIFFFIRSLIMIGAFFGQYVQEKHSSSAIKNAIGQLSSTTIADFKAEVSAMPPSLAGVYLIKILDHSGNIARIDMLLAEYEIETNKNIATSKILTKMGPILGLMGTLIPMGPALVGLASGDIASMAYNMQVAFATTVVGLVISAIGFLTQQAKERWAMKNLTSLEYVADVIKQSHKSDL